MILVAVVVLVFLQNWRATVIPLVAANGPVNYCFSPVTVGPPGGYVFTSGAGTASNNVVMVRFFRSLSGFGASAFLVSAV